SNSTCSRASCAASRIRRSRPSSRAPRAPSRMKQQREAARDIGRLRRVLENEPRQLAARAGGAIDGAEPFPYLRVPRRDAQRALETGARVAEARAGGKDAPVLEGGGGAGLGRTGGGFGVARRWKPLGRMRIQTVGRRVSIGARGKP